MAPAQLRRVEAGAGGGARDEVLDEDVGARYQAAQQCLVTVGLEIERDRLLAAVEPDEIGALAMDGGIVGAGEIALGPLDLDDTGPGIGQPAGTERRRDRLFDADDEDAVEPRHQ
jgi:hypothetical protein